MKHLVETLPVTEDVKAQLLAAFDEKEAALAQLKQRYQTLLEQFKLSRQRQFSPGSESAEQLRLFDEADKPLSQGAKADIAEVTATVTNRRQRRRGHRRPIPEHYPREVTVLALDESDRRCGCGHEMVEIGEVVTEQLDVVPLQIKVRRYVRKKYGCRACEEGIKTTPLPSLFLPKSMASPGMVAHTITS